MKNFLVVLIGFLILIGAAVRWSKSLQSSDPDVVAINGLHSHPILEIYIKGEKQSISTNIGIGGQYSSLPMGMSPIHTHDDAVEGIIHLEFSGAVRKSDITLGEFLKTWDKDINSFGSNVKMAVNGVENLELDQYVMGDGDRIELRYE
jgi:hypothetical protein